MLDIRPFFNAFQAPEFNVILKNARKSYPNDPNLVVRELSGRGLGVFKIISSTEPDLDHIKFQRKKRWAAGDESISIPLTLPREGRGERREGLLITIVDAALENTLSIPARVFNSALAEFGEVVMSTKPQKYKDSDVMNGNRMIVVDRNEKPLPDRLVIDDKSFLLKYRGKVWFCQTCVENHIGSCPYLKQFYEALDAKKKLKISHHIIADSSLRLAEQVGIKANITCMSGATAGQLATAVEEDTNEIHKDIIIAAGCNDVKVSDLENERSVVKRIDASLKRVIEVIAKKQDKNFLFLNTSPPKSNLNKTQELAHRYFEKRMEKLLGQHDNALVVKVEEYPEAWVDGHPTRNSTGTMMQTLVKEVPELLINEDMLTTGKMYRGVRSVYLSGCTGCISLGIFDEGGFCKSCVNNLTMKKLEDENLFKRIQKQISEAEIKAKKRHHSNGDQNEVESKREHQDVESS